MNTTRYSHSKAPRAASISTPTLKETEHFQRDFEEVTVDNTQIVEHLTVPGFMKRIPHRFHMDDINRFGDKVGKAAESLHLAYVTTVDRSLGMIRMFPVPLMKRVYDVMARQFGWPMIIEEPPATIEDQRKVAESTIRAHERLGSLLQAVLESAADEEVRHSAARLASWVDEDLGRLRADLEAGQV